jgi:hypothetical protein
MTGFAGVWMIPAAITVVAWVWVFFITPTKIDRHDNHITLGIGFLFDGFAILIRSFIALVITSVSWMVWAGLKIWGVV